MTVLTTIAAALPQGFTIVSDPPPGRDLLEPHIIIYGASINPAGRRLTGWAAYKPGKWTVMCISNRMAGATSIAGKIVDALDGVIIDDRVVRVTHVSDPLEDRDDPTAWRWSCNVEYIH